MGRRSAVWVMAGGVLLGPAVALGTVRLQATSATVAQQGGVGQVCVILGVGGEQVSGLESKLVWDGACATLTGAGDCVAAGSHGKNVTSDIDHQPDFSVKVLVLSLGDMDPMPDGPVYCCSFQGEAEPGQCCNVAVAGAVASDPKGSAVSVTASGGKICTAGNGAGQAIGSIDRGIPAPVSGGGVPGGGDAPGAAAPLPEPAAPEPAAPSVAPPVAQVLQGGGGNVPAPAAEGAAAPARSAGALAGGPTYAPPPAAPPEEGSALTGGAQLGSTAAGVAAPATTAPAELGAEPGDAASAETSPPASHAVPPAATVEPSAAVHAEAAATPGAATPGEGEGGTAAPTAVSTIPVSGATPVESGAVPAAAATTSPPVTAPVTPLREEAAKPAAGSGWFGCQLGAGASAAPAIGLGLAAALAALVRRWRREAPRR